MTSFTWLDYSDHERQQAMEVIDLFREEDTRDELGLGTIRDPLADLLFPGTSTIQTRARYFLFVPWLYLDLERRQIPSADFAKRSRIVEIKLIDSLADSADNDGTIGIDARASLKRLPSNIYWQGLADLGIRLFAGSQEQYHREADSFHSARRQASRTEDGDIIGTAPVNWHQAIPEPPSSFPKRASFK